MTDPSKTHKTGMTDPSKTHKTGMTKDLEDSFLDTDKSPNICIMDKINGDKGST